MKAVLFICLLAVMACTFVDVIKCIYETPIVQEIISLAIECLIKKDWNPLIEKVKGSIFEIIQAIIGCIKK